MTGLSRLVDRPDSPGAGGGVMLAAMLSLPRRLLVLVGLLALLFVACGLLYVALQLRDAWWLLGAVVAFGVLVVLWVTTIVALRRGVRRRRDAEGHEQFSNRR